MNALDQLFAAPQYSLTHAEKSALLLAELRRLTDHHRARCEPYRRLLGNTAPGDSLAAIPFLPARLFKLLPLQSISEAETLKVLTSSGTSSQTVSRIVLDKETSVLQTKALVAIVTSFIGPKRLPMIIIDSASILRTPGSLSARAAGLVGLANFGRDHFYALDEQMQLDLAGLKAFAAKHAGERILIFGFTFMVWQYLYRELQRRGETLALPGAILIHSGGWKKLQDQAVTNDRFKEELLRQCGIQQIYNFYGMVEQVGSIYMECERGYLHTPNFAEILIRDHRDWSVRPVGQPGLIQTLSVLPRSFPGHSLLTEDLGTIHGIDDCPCGRKGTYFTVAGRIPQAELRGCSDTHAYGTAETRTDDGMSVTQFLPTRVEAVPIDTLCAEQFFRQPPTPAFDKTTVEFLAEISRGILGIPSVQQYPELVALAFWLRKANLQPIIDEFLRTVGDRELAMPRGTAFHVAPANVDTIFLYSWALSMLAGNANVVRISQNANPQLDELLDVLRKVMSAPQWRAIANRNVVITYPRDERVNRYLSSQADVRILWGGDATVQTIRAIPAKPATKDIAFADKFSYAVVHAERYAGADDARRTKTAQAFYNDAYSFNQMACSSPQLVYFIGPADACETASAIFWKQLGLELRRRQHQEPMAVATDKLVTGYQVVAKGLGKSSTPAPSGTVPTVVRVPFSVSVGQRDRCGGGFFYECFAERLEDLAQVVQPHDQTLSYVEFTRAEMHAAAHGLCPQGIERIVPVGQALAFTAVWDGYVLLNELTRRITIA